VSQWNGMFRRFESSNFDTDMARVFLSRPHDYGRKLYSCWRSADYYW